MSPIAISLTVFSVVAVLQVIWALRLRRKQKPHSDLRYGLLFVTAIYNGMLGLGAPLYVTFLPSTESGWFFPILLLVSLLVMLYAMSIITLAGSFQNSSSKN